MAHHEHVKLDYKKEIFKFEGGLKTLCLVFIGLGLIGMLWAFFGYKENHHSRFWSNILLNTYYFNGMAIAAVFLIAAHSIGYGGWHTIIKRVILSMGSFVFVSFVFFVLILLGLWYDWHGLYHHWTHAPATDTVVGDKKAFLNKYTFTAISLVFYAGWMWLTTWMRSHSLAEDNASDPIAHNQKAKYISSGYIVLFGVSTSIFSWLAVMSLDPHWYSTLFGWYNFASYMCGFLSMAILMITYLKYKGHLVNVNENHLHNLSMLLFGFSVFYTYLWFSQFLLIWYGNIPEDTMYFVKRFRIPLFKVLFFVTLAINFIFPFLFFIKRKAKRNFWLMNIAAVILIFGHYLDFYLMVMPEPNTPAAHGDSEEHHANIYSKSALLASAVLADSTRGLDSSLAVSSSSTSIHSTDAITTASAASHSEIKKASKESKEHQALGEHTNFASLGLIEIFIFLGFIGLFLYTSLTVLSKHRITPPINNPFIEESLNHHY